MDNLFDKLKFSKSILLTEVEKSPLKNPITFFSSDEEDGGSPVLTKDDSILNSDKRVNSTISDDESMSENLQMVEESDNDDRRALQDNKSDDKEMEIVQMEGESKKLNEAQNYADQKKDQIQINGILESNSTEERRKSSKNIETNSNKLAIDTVRSEKMFDLKTDLFRTTKNAERPISKVMPVEGNGFPAFQKKLAIRLKRLSMEKVLLPKETAIRSETCGVKRKSTISSIVPIRCKVRIKRLKLDKIVPIETKVEHPDASKPNRAVKLLQTTNKASGSHNRSMNSTATNTIEKDSKRRSKGKGVTSDVPSTPKQKRGRRSKTNVERAPVPVATTSQLSLRRNRSTQKVNDSATSNNESNRSRIVNDIVEIDICSSNRIDRNSISPPLPSLPPSHPIRQFQHSSYSHQQRQHSYNSPSSSYLDCPSTSRRYTKRLSFTRKIVYDKEYLKQVLEHDAKLAKNRKLKKTYGKSIFMSYIKLKRPREEDYAHLPASIRPRKHILKMPGIAKKTKRLTVSFHEKIQTFGETSYSDTDEEEDVQNNNNNGQQPKVDDNIKLEETSEIEAIDKNELLKPLPKRFRQSYGSEYHDVSYADTTTSAASNISKNLEGTNRFMADNSLITSTPNLKQPKSKRKKPVLTPLKDDSFVSPRQAQLKLANEKLPSKTSLKELLNHDTDDSEEDESASGIY